MDELVEITSRTWIGHLIDRLDNDGATKNLENVFIPGSLDACAYKVDSSLADLPIIGDIYKSRVLKQKYNIIEQFEMGVRAFDIFVVKDGDNYNICTKDFNGDIIIHEKLENFLKNINYMLVVYKGESIIINLRTHGDSIELNKFISNKILGLNKDKTYTPIYNTSLSAKLEKNKLYFVSNIYLPIMRIDKNIASGEQMTLIEKAITENIDSGQIIGKSYSMSVDSALYNKKYAEYGILSIVISTILLIILISLYYISNTDYVKKNVKININIQMNIFFYMFFIMLYIFLTLLLVHQFIDNDIYVSTKISCIFNSVLNGILSRTYIGKTKKFTTLNKQMYINYSNVFICRNIYSCNF